MTTDTLKLISFCIINLDNFFSCTSSNQCIARQLFQADWTFWYILEAFFWPGRFFYSTNILLVEYRMFIVELFIGL